MGVDLHTHTTASDGSDSPTELIVSATALGLSAVAITDHDTTEGLQEAEEAAAATGIELVAGVELSLQWNRGGMHLLVLMIRDRELLSFPTGAGSARQGPSQFGDCGASPWPRRQYICW